MAEIIFHAKCPHCSGEIIIHESEIACGIFRHGVLKSTGEQIPPHADKSTCDSLFTEGKIYGCGKPFRATRDGNEIKIEICDYI